MVGSGPFQKLNLCDQLESHPNTSLHLRGSEALTHRPATGSGRLTKGHFGVVQCLRVDYALGGLCARRDWYFQEKAFEKYQFRLTHSRMHSHDAFPSPTGAQRVA
jgi:hypothetical protein